MQNEPQTFAFRFLMLTLGFVDLGDEPEVNFLGLLTNYLHTARICNV